MEKNVTNAKHHLNTAFEANDIIDLLEMQDYFSSTC